MLPKLASQECLCCVDVLLYSQTKQPFPRPRTVQEAYGTGYALWHLTFLALELSCVYAHLLQYN